MKRSTPTPSERRVVWQSHLAGWRASGQSQVAYCREHDLSSAQFRWWKRTLDAGGAPPSAAALPEATSAFVAVQLKPEVIAVAAPARSDSGVVLHWRELRIELALGFDLGTLRAVLQTLGH